MNSKGVVTLILAMIMNSPLALAQNSGICGPELTYKVKISGKSETDPHRGDVYITGKGDMTDSPWQNLENVRIRSVKFPNGITSISAHSFERAWFDNPFRFSLFYTIIEFGPTYVKARDAVVIPNTVKTIGDYAFNLCRFDNTPFIPASVVSVGKESFGGTDFGLTEYWREKTPGERIGGAGLEIIGERAFEHSDIPSFTFAENLRSIGQYAFANNKFFERVRIKQGLKVLSEGVFYKCSGLAYVVIDGSSIKTIESKVFEGCTSIKSIKLPESLESIGERAFLGCNSLATINIPESVKTIGSYAFWNCSDLRTLIIPNSVSSIGEGVLAYCSSLRSIESKWSSKDNRCLIVDRELKVFAPSQLTKYSIPNDVKSIGSYAFAGCDNLTSISLPAGLETIGRYAFKDCDGLTTVSIPSGVTTIKKGAFENCDKLELVIIPQTVSKIEENAFSDCANMQYVFIMNKGLEVEKTVFPSNVKVYYTDSNTPPAVLAIQSLTLKDYYRSNVINGGTSNFLEVTVINEGSGYGSGTARILMSGNTSGLSSSAVSLSIYPNENVVVRIPINADYNVTTGYVNLRVQLTIDNGVSRGNDLLKVQTQAHGISAERLSDNGRRYKRAAEELLSNAKNAEGLLSTIKEYEKLTQSDPYYADAYFNLGKLYTSLAKIKGNPYFDKALENYRVFEKLLPEERKAAEDEIYAVQTLKNNYKTY